VGSGYDVIVTTSIQVAFGYAGKYSFSSRTHCPQYGHRSAFRPIFGYRAIDAPTRWSSTTVLRRSFTYSIFSGKYLNTLGCDVVRNHCCVYFVVPNVVILTTCTDDAS
jgi:hypothetical protein